MFVQILALCSCLAASSAISYDVEVDLSNGVQIGSDPGVTWHQNLTGAGLCAQRGVLKLNFRGGAKPKDKVRIDLTFSNPKRFVFNIGDSATNNAWGGDSSTQSRDAEVMGYSRNLAVYSNDHHSPRAFRYVLERNIVGTETNTLSIIVADGIVIWHNLASYYNFLRADDTFALKGQKDTQGSVNYDIYLGMNRVVYGGRTGTGLCRAAIKWL